MNEGYLAAVEQAWLACAGRGLMLSARDLERVRAWARAGVPAEVVVQGIHAAFENAPARVFGIDYAVPAVERCVRAWRERKVGEHARDEASNPDLHQAFDALLERIAQAGRAVESPALREVLRDTWRSVRDLSREAAADAEADPVAALEALAGEMFDAALAALPPDTREDIEAEVDAALVEERRFTPRDAFEATRRAHLHRRVREETGLPELRLRLSRGW